jgi:hypothetical protein
MGAIAALGALPHDELLDARIAHLGDSQPIRFQPPAEPRHLAKLAHRRPHRIATPTKLLPIRVHNGANGPVINTLLTVLVALAIQSSFSGKRAGKKDHNHSRYADLNPADIPTCADFLAGLGITTGSA